MKLKDFHDLWIAFGENELIIIDKKEALVYHDFYQAINIWFRPVDSFYISNNKLYIKVK